LQALLEINRKRCRPELSEREVRRIATSVSRYPPGANGQVVRVERSILQQGLSAGAIALYVAAQAMRQNGGWSRRVDLAQALRVSVWAINKWARELKEAGLYTYERPRRRFIRAPVRLFLDPNVSYRAKVAALHIAALLDSNGIAQVGLATLAKRTGHDRVTLWRYMRELTEHGHVEVTRAVFSPTYGRRKRCNRYALVALKPPGAHEKTSKKMHVVQHSASPRCT
jgi:biotin operon repressor